MQSPKHAWPFQSEFKGGLYTPKLPINRSSGHYVTESSFLFLLILGDVDQLSLNVTFLHNMEIDPY